MNAFAYDHGENGMGDEIEYRHDGVIVCEECGNEIQFRISGFEYPVGAYNYDDHEIYGGDFEESPIVESYIVRKNLILIVLTMSLIGLNGLF